MLGFRVFISTPKHSGIGFWHTLAWPRRLLTLLLGLTLISIFTLTGLSIAEARPLYSCGNASSGTHCYALAYSGASGFYNAQGSTAKITVVQMQCSQCGGNPGTTTGFISNEIWVFDGSSNWIELGYRTRADTLHSWEEYFWADKRPVDCSGCINNHTMGNVPSGDYSQYATLTIKRTGSTSFHVTLSSPNASKSGDSTSNTMTVQIVEMGQELAGNAGASAPYARYIYRYYWNSSGVSTAIGQSYTPTYSNPPWWNQITGTTVGDFETHCC